MQKRTRGKPPGMRWRQLHQHAHPCNAKAPCPHPPTPLTHPHVPCPPATQVQHEMQARPHRGNRAPHAGPCMRQLDPVLPNACLLATIPFAGPSSVADSFPAGVLPGEPVEENESGVGAGRWLLGGEAQTLLRVLGLASCLAFASLPPAPAAAGRTQTARDECFDRPRTPDPPCLPADGAARPLPLRTTATPACLPRACLPCPPPPPPPAPRRRCGTSALTSASPSPAAASAAASSSAWRGVATGGQGRGGWEGVGAVDAAGAWWGSSRFVGRSSPRSLVVSLLLRAGIARQPQQKSCAASACRCRLTLAPVAIHPPTHASQVCRGDADCDKGGTRHERTGVKRLLACSARGSGGIGGSGCSDAAIRCVYAVCAATAVLAALVQLAARGSDHLLLGHAASLLHLYIYVCLSFQRNPAPSSGPPNRC